MFGGIIGGYPGEKCSDSHVALQVSRATHRVEQMSSWLTDRHTERPVMLVAQHRNWSENSSVGY